VVDGHLSILFSGLVQEYHDQVQKCHHSGQSSIPSELKALLWEAYSAVVATTDQLQMVWGIPKHLHGKHRILAVMRCHPCDCAICAPDAVFGEKWWPSAEHAYSGLGGGWKEETGHAQE